ncbi:TPA: GNAT family N-acetyltransferase [Providencia stuartii]|uniref:GNAT family N-acetyltransferase n=1 Tax=Providencia stuartii TaxID=588 RepID=UPI0011409231|nr:MULTISPECIES: GNAT family N-acetyltransferase [Providencia]MBN5561124.1 GNAT family N-acetyltransferase [Providencia stuartii]MBN5600808.1 GNAT family N-acetyltransferase [Providencia stuartii]MBN5604621.1 GNAT family N-acetyltransferase [Providencia stuartii]MCL8326172.1 GNAT family N-acetyltransferase [Providencia thailandensis]MDF4174434.1 GNAT family N-acetyltransferase [Providencia thailandensis]
MSIQSVATVGGLKQQLDWLLIDCVNSGASIGFIAPITQVEARNYWQTVDQGLQTGERLLLVKLVDKQLAGAIQLSFCAKANGRHRAEVEKLMVHTAFRQQGIAKQLLLAVEQVALSHQRTLLVLDTRTGDVAAHLYRQQDYIEVGEIPHFVSNAQQEFESTTIFYKHLSVNVSS